MCCSTDNQAAFVVSPELMSMLPSTLISEFFVTPSDGGDKTFWDYFYIGNHTDAAVTFIDHIEDNWLYLLVE